MVKVVTFTSTVVWGINSITVQRIRMKFCVSVATNSDCVSLSLGLCSLFTFGVVRCLLHRFDAPFKCTVD